MTPEPMPVVLSEDFSADAIHTLCEEGQEACIQQFPELKDHPELLKEILQIEEGISYYESRVVTLKGEADDLGLKLKQILVAAPEASR